MPRTRVKICGICRAADALAAADAGADAIGINFDPASPRNVSIAQASEIVRAVPPFISVIGLFVDADVAAISKVMEEIPLSAVQLHGHESPELVAKMKPLPVIKVVRTDEGDELPVWHKAIDGLKLTNLLGILMETPRSMAGMSGGSGVSNDWPRLHDLNRAGRFQRLGALIVAGGLTAENVGDVIRLLRPFAVDVSSGVESGKREKSAEKITAFIRAVREADARLES